jgi:hypothetical protein
MKNFAILLALATTMVACKKKFTQADLDAANAAGYSSGNTAGYSAGQSNAQANAVKAAYFITSLYESVGNTTSYDFELVKFGKDNANYAVINVSGAENFVMAVDITNYTVGTNYYTHISANNAYAYLTDNGNGTYSCGVGCMNTNVSGPATTSMVFENTVASVKDLEKAAAFVESYKVETLASSLSAQFGLSEERATTVAKLASSYEKLSKSRALTNADADAFSKELTGVTISEMQGAYKSMTEGSTSELNAVLEIAAEVNGTSSENMAVIMNKLFF